MAPRVLTALRGIGQTLITLGVVLLLYVVWSLWYTGIGTAQAQNTLYSDLTDEWAAPPPAEEVEPADIELQEVPLGDGVAILRIPRFGADYNPVIVEGTTRPVLRTGPGHYSDTVMPGEVGNFSVAGHRTTYGAPFNRMDEMSASDPIVVETATSWFTYQVTAVNVVLPTAVDVVAPVPGEPGATPTEAMLTFTTCNPEYSSRERLIVHATLVEERSREDGPPPLLTDPAYYAAAESGA